jgi:hypothetical protein
MDERVRVWRGLSEVQVLQWQPITGTPVDVLVPRNVRVTVLWAVFGFNLGEDWHIFYWRAKIKRLWIGNV